MPRRFSRSLVFRQTALYVALFIVLEMTVFGFLYWSTVSVYVRHVDRDITKDIRSLRDQLGTLTVTQMATVITRRTTDNPGEFDLYILATAHYEPVAGNVTEWPRGIADESGVVAIDMWPDDGVDQRQHHVRTTILPQGQHLLVGRNLGELRRMRTLIGKSLLRTVLLTLVLGFGGGFVFSKMLAKRLDKINASAFAILRGDISRRIPIQGTDDEIDQLSRNLNRMLDRIESLMRGMREVTDNVAHDIRKPISRLRSRIEVTLMGPSDIDAYREALECTIEEADHILALFNSLLTIAEAESGALRDRFESVDVTAVARSAVEFYEPLAQDNGISIRFHADGDVRMRGEPHLIAQAIGNLLDNAIKHAPGSGDLEVAVDGHGDRATVTVADRGPGIPADCREKVLERFSRLEESRTTPGSGLGLSLVQAVARLHGGSVTLEDHAPGLKVTLTLPAV